MTRSPATERAYRGRSAQDDCRRRRFLVLGAAMEELFGNPAYKGFVLQDKKRLPSRFFARISGALTSRLS
jgi:hypothetical protein